MLAAARQILADNLHILVYTDIGMDPITTMLAALRLAPVQCKGWGHPVTTGLPTIDYYLSSDLMEPDNAENYYSESLLRLPNLALYYQPPKLPVKPKSRQELGIPENKFVYLTTQSLFKYLPQHDDIYPRIAKAVPDAFFVFLSHQSEFTTSRFMSRLRRTFADHGLRADKYCLFSPRLDFQDFLSLNLAADVLLDSLEWSGGKTTLEALSCGLPVVTLPGRFMRGRHAYAMLRMMNCTETIAGDKSAYCGIAIRLASDTAFYSRIKAEVTDKRHRLFQDRTFMQALESFSRSVFDSHRNPRAAEDTSFAQMSN
jgi:predicted O-linked N-acetylglucosamine transferase (SPINDLY family)